MIQRLWCRTMTGKPYFFPLAFIFPLLFLVPVQEQDTPEELIQKVRLKLDKVNDYEAQGRMKTNVIFIKAPIAKIKVYYKKPNKLRINNESGISFVPKGSVNINLNTVF